MVAGDDDLMGEIFGDYFKFKKSDLFEAGNFADVQGVGALGSQGHKGDRNSPAYWLASTRLTQLPELSRLHNPLLTH